jgi:hypothetical protein
MEAWEKDENKRGRVGRVELLQVVEDINFDVVMQQSFKVGGEASGNQIYVLGDERRIGNV